MIIFSAFVIGLVGSLHCVGMCGPLMLAAQQRGDGWQQPVFYQAGRLTTYLLLGFLLGGLGLGLQLWNLQSTLAVLSGGLLVTVAALRLWKPTFLVSYKPIEGLYFKLRVFFGSQLGNTGNSAHFALGLCNGLLPCGMVYLAAVGAANVGNPLGGGLFMLGFGLGTLPLLTVTLVAGKRLIGSNRIQFQQLASVLMLIAGGLLLWRGYGRYIPLDYHQFTDLVFPPSCH